MLRVFINIIVTINCLSIKIFPIIMIDQIQRTILLIVIVNVQAVFLFLRN